MLKFLQEKFGYGLAGFLIGIFIIAFEARITNSQISGNYLWAGPVGFVIGLLLPKEIISNVFLGFIRSRPVAMRNYEENLNPDEVQSGRIVKLIYVIGILFLLFLVYLVFKGVFSK